MKFYDDFDILINQDMCEIMEKYSYLLKDSYSTNNMQFLFGQKFNNNDTTVFLDITKLCLSYKNIYSDKTLNSVIYGITNYLNTFSRQLAMISNLPANYNYELLTNKDFQKNDFIIEFFMYKGYKIIYSILKQSLNQYTNASLNALLTFFILFIVIVIINQFVIWRKIENMILDMESETYYLFSIFPIKIILDYSYLKNFVESASYD